MKAKSKMNTEENVLIKSTEIISPQFKLRGTHNIDWFP